MPTRHRGWSLVLVGGIGAVGGYFAASWLSALLQPYFGWRIMWLLNLPTGNDVGCPGKGLDAAAKPTPRASAGTMCRETPYMALPSIA